MKPSLIACLALLIPCMLPSCQSTSSATQETSAEVTLPPYNGPKARILIDDFIWGVGGDGSYAAEWEYEGPDGETHRGRWSAQSNKVTNGLQASLSQSLMSTDRFIVQDRAMLKQYKQEQKLKDEGIVKADTAPKMGRVNSAELLIRGTVLEWEEDASGSGGMGGGFLGPIAGGIGLSSQKGKVVVQVEIIDLETGDKLVSRQVRGEASSSGLTFGGFGWGGGAILGGWAGIELVKRRLQLGTQTGEFFVYPLAVGTAIARLGCFATGLEDQTHGLATGRPWGVDFGDGVARHPTQLYEVAFVLLLAVGLHRCAQRRGWEHGLLFRHYVTGYLTFRLAVEFLKPREVWLPGLSVTQVICAVAVAWLWWRCSPEPQRAD